MYLWTWLIYWGGPFSLREYTIELTNARWGVNVAMGAVAVGAVLFLARRNGEDGSRDRRLMAGVCLAALVSGLAGTALALLLAVDATLPATWVVPVALISGLFTGLSEGFLLCRWCSLTSLRGVRAALFNNAVALAVGGALFLVCKLAPVWVSLAVGMLCPPACFLAALKAGSPDADPARTEPVAASPAQVESASAQVLAPLRDPAFRMLACLALVFGLSNGFINAGFEVVPQSLYRLSCYGVVVGTILASGLTFLAAFALKLDAWRLVFCVSLPLMAVSYLLFPYEVFWYVGWGVHALGYQFFFMTLWSLLGSRQLRHGASPVVSVCVGLFAVELGSALGLALWNAFCIGIDQAGEHVVSGLALMLLVLVAVLFERPQFGWGDVQPGVAVPPNALPVDDYLEVMQRIRIGFSLSPRELEVCKLLGRGRNRQFVAAELGVSLETAKTHTTNVYRKLGVHSQQELLDVIESVRAELAADRAAAVAKTSASKQTPR